MNQQVFSTTRRVVAAAVTILGVTAGSFAAVGQATIEVDVNQPGHRIPPSLWGIFFEEINCAGDGGIYAEMVQNRSFEEPSHTDSWKMVTTGMATGQMAADSSLPLSAADLWSLRLTQSSSRGSVGAANGGYWGMNLQAGQVYDLNLYARCSAGFSGALSARLENGTGTQVLAQGTMQGLTTAWKQYSLALTPSATDAGGRLVVAISEPATVWLDGISLFPRQTFHSRRNGLRPDLANMLADLQPAFVRFPGGSWIDGGSLANAYRWKQTIGNLGDRAVQWDLWGYYVDNGLGYHEYLQTCEDLGAQPLFVINCGMDVSQNAVPIAQMGPWVQDALDAIEYANGGVNTTWGAQRAANGHPAPFNLHTMEIGNENGGQAYDERYALFYDAIKAQYPQMTLIADTPTNHRQADVVDEHYYSDPGFFTANATRYDTYSRSGPKVYVGEYAVTSGSGNGNLRGALAEAAFMTGIERNSDVVVKASYAPLLTNVNCKKWNPDLIYFDSSRVCATPSYHVQRMFAGSLGDVVLPVSLATTMPADANQTQRGAIGLGAWNTQVEYTDVRVTKASQTLYQSDFTTSTAGWDVYNGTWSTAGGSYRQTAMTTDCRSTTGDTSWGDYTLTLRARKTGGNEGFLILFNWLDDDNWTWWNLGGWNNTQHAIEYCQNGGKSILGSAVSGQIVANRWYDIRVELSGSRIRCYLDGQLVHEVGYPDSRGGAIGLGTWSTCASFTNVVVTKGSETLYQSDFNAAAAGWKVYKGTWFTSGGVYQQTDAGTDRRSTTGDTAWSDYTLSLGARKDSGAEGFLILFNWLDDNNWTWWNIGGWGNTQHAIEVCANGTKSTLGSSVNGSVQTHRWYDVRVELAGSRIRCYLDNQLIHDVSSPTPSPLYASASLREASGSGQVLLKVVNVSSLPIATAIRVNAATGIDPNAAFTRLTSSNPGDENTLDDPTKVAPVTGTLNDAGTAFTHTFPAYSLTVLDLQTRPSSR